MDADAEYLRTRAGIEAIEWNRLSDELRSDFEEHDKQEHNMSAQISTQKCKENTI